MHFGFLKNKIKFKSLILASKMILDTFFYVFIFGIKLPEYATRRVFGF